MNRMKLAAGVSLAALAMAGGASAQDALSELRAQNAAAQAAEIARQDLLATQREIPARQDQARTAMVLRDLETARTQPPGTAGLAAPPPATIMPRDDGLTSLSMQMDRMQRLTQDAMARSNAKVRAVRPASER
jgi:hypothetical protein